MSARHVKQAMRGLSLLLFGLPRQCALQSFIFKTSSCSRFKFWVETSRTYDQWQTIFISGLIDSVENRFQLDDYRCGLLVFPVHVGSTRSSCSPWVCVFKGIFGVTGVSLSTCERRFDYFAERSWLLFSSKEEATSAHSVLNKTYFTKFEWKCKGSLVLSYRYVLVANAVFQSIFHTFLWRFMQSSSAASVESVSVPELLILSSCYLNLCFPCS